MLKEVRHWWRESLCLTFRHSRAGTQFHLSNGCPLTLGGLQLLIGFVAPSLWVRPVLCACHSTNFDQLLSLLIVSADMDTRHAGCCQYQNINFPVLRILLSACMTRHK